MVVKIDIWSKYFEYMVDEDISLVSLSLILPDVNPNTNIQITQTSHLKALKAMKAQKV